MNLNKILTAGLPDWFNPVFVKEVRQTLNGRSFWIISVLIVLFELALGGALYRFNAAPPVVIALLLTFPWILGSTLMLQPAVSRWTEERHLDAIAPERTTSLSVWSILKGKLTLYALLLVWCALLILPLLIAACGKLDHEYFGEAYKLQSKALFASGAISFLMILALNAWTTVVAMTMRIRRNATGGLGFFGWSVLCVGTFFIMFVLQPLTTGVFMESQTLCWHFAAMAFPLLTHLIYAILLLAALMKPEFSNRMFAPRLGGYLLCLATAGFCFAARWCGKDSGGMIAMLLFSLVSYVSFQSIIAAFEPLTTPRRMLLDAPRNRVLKLLWFTCGSGAVCAWLHLLIPFALISGCYWLKFMEQELNSMLGVILVFCCYYIIYGAVTGIIRIFFPALNGGLIFIAVNIAAGGFDIFASIVQLSEAAYASPIFYIGQQLAHLMPDGKLPDNGINQAILDSMSVMTTPVLLVTWALTAIMLLATGYAAVTKRVKK